MLISPAKLELYEDRVDKFRGFLEVFLLLAIIGFMVFEMHFVPLKRKKPFWRPENVDKMLWFLVSIDFYISAEDLMSISSLFPALLCGALSSVYSTP